MSKFATYFDKESFPKVNGTVNNMESLTDQSFKSMCEIEQLLVNYRGTPRTPVYDMDNYDTSNWTFEDWQNEKARLERKFLHLDPEMKSRFNTPQEFFKYCSNPENYILDESGKYVEAPEPVVDIPTPLPEVKPEVINPPQA